MKIVYCITALYNSGGMERVLSCKANYLASLGHEIHIVTTDQRGRPTFFEFDERIKLHDLDINHEETSGTSLWRKASAYPFKYLKHKKRLSRLLMELRADVVISMFGPAEGSIIPKIKDSSRKILEYHFSKNKRLQYGRTGLWRKVDEWRTKQDETIVRQFDDFVVLTQEDRELWGDLSNIHVIPNPLPFTSEVISPLTAKTVIAAGRYDYQKNFRALIDIWATIAPKYPDWHLRIFGDGALRGDLESYVDELGLRNISLEKPTKDMKAAYLSSSIYAMTSLYEGLPMVLLEAQTMGLPIVSYACQCGPRDIITDGENGYLIEMHDAKTFAQALERLMSSKELRQEMGKSARRASERYQLERVMQQWLDLLGI